MASAQRQADPDLIALALERGGDDFFELVRSIERLARVRAGDAPPAGVGRDGPPADEPVRFHAVTGLAFPGRAVERLWRRPDQAERVELDVTFMGLTGPTGVLPQHYSNLVQARLKQRDAALADFLDLFNHRLIGLYYRAWAKYRPSVQQEDADGRDAYGRVLQALAGQQPHHRFEPRLYYGGHFSRTARSASDLERLLADYLGQPVRVESFIGQWLPIATEHRLRIGSGERGCNNRLGDGVALGARTWDVQSKLRIRIGPISDAEHSRLLPEEERFADLRRLIEEYTPSHLDVELEFLVADAQRRRLGRQMRLGQNAWLQSGALPVRRARIQLRRKRYAPSPVGAAPPRTPQDPRIRGGGAAPTGRA